MWVCVVVCVRVELQQDSHGPRSPEPCVETRGEAPRQSRRSGSPGRLLSDDTSAPQLPTAGLFSVVLAGKQERKTLMDVIACILVV